MRLHQRRLAALTGAVVVAVGLVLAAATPAGAHPLGNFTTNTSTALRIQPDAVEVGYVIDLAEIPAFQARSDIDADGDDALSPEERRRYATETCANAAEGLDLTVGDEPVPLEVQEEELSFPPGEAGLDTLRLECALGGSIEEIDGRTTVRLADGNFAERLGWREITAVGDRTTRVEADVPSSSSSERLTSYPEGRLSSPLDERTANVEVVPGGPAAEPEEDSTSPLPSADRLTSLIGERALTIPFAAFSLGVAFGLGAFHALAPGHGKTAMAAYLLGEEGTRRQALLLGLTVAATHTGGVFALGLVVTNSSVAPERFYPWLGTASGLLVVSIGVVLLTRAVRFRRRAGVDGLAHGHHHHGGFGFGHSHSHDHEPGHDHQDHEPGHAHHDHDPTTGHTHAQPSELTRGEHDDGRTRLQSATATTLTAPHERDDRAHGESHAHDDHERDHGGDRSSSGDDATLVSAPPMRTRGLVAMGFAGGLVPSPSALVVLLGAIAIGRAWFGLALITAYGLGLAAVLVGAGLLIERLRDRVERFLEGRTRPRLARLTVNLPIITAGLVVAGGVFLAVRALTLA